MRSRATSSSRSTGAGGGPKRSISSAWIVATSAVGAARPRRRYSSSFMRLLGNVVVGQVGIDRQVDHRLRAAA